MRLGSRRAACTLAGVELYKRARWREGRVVREGAISRGKHEDVSCQPCARCVRTSSSSEPSRSSGRHPRVPRRPKLDNGIGTQAALANPNCDPQTKQIKILLIARAPCVKHVDAAKNGGSTAPGVTKDSVKVVIVVEEDPTKPATTPGGIGIAGKNQATGGAGTLADDAKYESDMLAHFYETLRAQARHRVLRTNWARRDCAARRRARDRGEEAVRGVERAEDHRGRVGAEAHHHVRRAERSEGDRNSRRRTGGRGRPTTSR